MCSGMNLRRIDALIRESQSELNLVKAEIKEREKNIDEMKQVIDRIVSERLP